MFAWSHRSDVVAPQRHGLGIANGQPTDPTLADQRRDVRLSPGVSGSAGDTCDSGTVRPKPGTAITLGELILLAEAEASCELYGLLKRADEKFVTERAYERPRFVEDLVRGIAARLVDDARLLGFSIAAENFESIHNHSAYAEIVRG